jgi:hypothetical protein
VQQLASWPLRGLPGLGGRGLGHVLSRSLLSGPGVSACLLAAQGAPGLGGPGIMWSQEETEPPLVRRANMLSTQGGAHCFLFRTNAFFYCSEVNHES